jgi:competence protein ComEC
VNRAAAVRPEPGRRTSSEFLPGAAGDPGRPADLRLLPAVAGAWVAAWWGTAAGVPARGVAAGQRPVAACLAAVTLAAVIWVADWLAGRRRGRRGRIGPAAVVVLAVMAVVLAVAAARCAVRYRQPLPQWAAGQAVVEVRARVTGDAHPVAGGLPGRPPQIAVQVTAQKVTGRGTTMDADAPVLLLGGEAWRAVTAGQSVVAVGRLRAADPGDAVVALLRAQGGPRAAIPGSWPWRMADRLRSGLREACQGLPADAGGLLPSLVVGDTTALPGQLRADLQAAGLTHLTAVSGANVAISAGAALWVASALGAGRRLRLLVTAVVLAGFVVVARPQPSVLRAAVMGGLALLGMAGARRSRGVPLLAGAGVVLLAVDPWLARSAGFALSCLATGGLLLLAPVWTRALARRLPPVLAAGLAVPAAAQAACGPVLVLLQPSVGTLSVPANLLAEPAVAPATVLGVVAALLAPVWPPAAHLLARLGGLATAWIAVVAHRAAVLPWALVPWPAGPGGALLLAGVTTAFVAVTTRPRGGPAPDGGLRSLGFPLGRRTAGDTGVAGGPRPGGAARGPRPGGAAGRPRPRRAALQRWVAVGVAALLAAVIGWTAGPRLPGVGHSSWPPRDWTVVQCDVGQGAALVARSGTDRAVVVDTGPDPRLMSRCLTQLGIRHLDVILLTHFHADHVGGLPGALAGRDVGEVLVSPLQEPGENAAAVQRELAAAHVRERIGWAGQGGQAGDDEVAAAGGRQDPAATGGGQDPAGAGAGAGSWSVRWRLLAPVLGAGIPAAPGQRFASGSDRSDEGSLVNESSLAYVLDIVAPTGSLRLVGLGDLEAGGQLALLAAVNSGLARLDPPADVVEVAHHGSARQVPELYAVLGARVALIGVGAGNDYGHPAASALDMLQQVGATAFRTDTEGAIAVVARPGGTLAVVPMRVTRSARDRPERVASRSGR